MTRNIISPVLFLALLPLFGGCYFQARGVVRPPSVVISATAPTAPRAVIVAGGSTTVAANVESSSRARANGVALPPPPRVVVTPASPPRVVVTPAPPSTIVAVIPAPPPRVVLVNDGPVGGLILGPAESVPTVSVSSAPPELPRATAVATAPDFRAGYVWIRGFHSWVDASWVWNPGQWIQERSGHVWVDARYDINRRVYQPGHWRVVTANTVGLRPERVEQPPRPQDLLPAVPPTLGASMNVHFSASAAVGDR